MSGLVIHDNISATAENSAIAAANALLRDLLADRNVTSEEDETRWLRNASAELRPIIEGMIRNGTFGELPIERRERITIETLFGDVTPMHLHTHDIESALSDLTGADDVEPLDHSEQCLRGELQQLSEAMTHFPSADVAVQHGYEGEYLNDQIQGLDLPVWMDENLDWDDLYNRTYGDLPMIEVGAVLYRVMSGL